MVLVGILTHVGAVIIEIDLAALRKKAYQVQDLTDSFEHFYIRMGQLGKRDAYGNQVV